MSDRRREIVNHMVGGEKQYRNYFAASVPSDDYLTLIEMEADGLVWRRTSSATDLLIFHATPKGLALLEGGEQ